MAVFFAFLNGVFLVFMVGNKATAGAYAGTDEGAFATAEQATDHSATCGGAADDFGFGVMTGGVAVLLALGAGVGFLSEGG